MRTHYKKSFVVIAVLAGLVTACSTQKNTAKTRWWHAFNARYNTYYNGTLAYIDGSLEKENGNKDNYTEILPLYYVGNKKSRELGKGNFDRAIEKCQKAIKLHSIKRRPEWTKSRKKTERDIAWLSRKEYNPFLWKAWMLMGRSQFHSGNFDEAASTFSYMSRLYQTQPAIYGRARAWLAKCYIEEEWMYDAEDVMRNMERDSIHWRAQKEWDYTYTDYYIHNGDYEKAVVYLRKVIKHEMRRKQRAREWYLMGQLQQALGNKLMAYKAFKHVVRLNPPYELAFNAQIAMTEVMAEGRSKKMIRRLKRMAVSDNNKEYLDQVYYAIGNIYLAEKDTARAIGAYEKGNEKSTRSGIEKGVLLLQLGDLYWEQEKYSDAQRCYGSAIGMLDKDRKDYKQLADRSKVLDELVPYTDAVHLQDSLQALAKMDEKSRNAAIDRVIEALKKKEKEEKKAAAEANAQNQTARNGAMGGRNQFQKTPVVQNNQQKGLWYFYNPTSVQQGKRTFQQQWGKRENVDNWQRSNKTVVADFGDATDSLTTELTPEQQDSIRLEEARQDSIKQMKDSAQNDPHKREYYLAQIPFTEEQVQESNLLIMDGLYHSGVIFKDKLDNLPLAEKALMRLVTQYPEYETKDNAYYHLFLLYSRKAQPEVAEQYLQALKDSFPDSQWTKVLTDPYFKENAVFGTHIEDSLYAATYDAFKDDRYDEVRANTKLSEERFPLGANRDKFLFIGGLSKLNDGDASGCLQDMERVVKDFPQSPVSEMAGMILNGVKAGRRLHGGKFDLGDVWSRRSVVLNDSDANAGAVLSAERNDNFYFVIAYKPDSVNENKLLYQLARYNFTSYMVRNFDIGMEEVDGLHRMVISGFRNFDEALQYARALGAQEGVVRAMGNSRRFIVGEKNLHLLGTHFSYDEYDVFYEKNFAPLSISTIQLLTEPADLPSQEVDEPVKKAEETDYDGYQDGTVVEGEADHAIENANVGTLLIPDEPRVVRTPKRAEQSGITVPVVNEPVRRAKPVEEGITVVPLEEEFSRPAAVETKRDSTQQKQYGAATPANKPKTVETPVKDKKEEVRPVKPVEPQQEDDGIYFDDDATAPDPQKEDKGKDNGDDYDLEDEYYDLDGF